MFLVRCFNMECQMSDVRCQMLKKQEHAVFQKIENSMSTSDVNNISYVKLEP